jgi:hypothetical protein
MLLASRLKRIANPHRNTARLLFRSNRSRTATRFPKPGTARLPPGGRSHRLVPSAHFPKLHLYRA